MSSKYGFITRMRSEGKITVPIELREYLNLQQGEFVGVAVYKPGEYEVLTRSQVTPSFSLPSDEVNYSWNTDGTLRRKQDV